MPTRSPGFPHGPSIKWPKVYEALRRIGMDKSKAAAISNAHYNKYRRWGEAGAPGPRSAAEYAEQRGRKARRSRGIPLPKSRQVEKHAAPIHPGTGTDQSVHGGGGILGTLRREQSQLTGVPTYGPNDLTEPDLDERIDPSDPDLALRDTGGINLATGTLPTTPQARELILDSHRVWYWWSSYEGAEAIRLGAAEFTGETPWLSGEDFIRTEVPVEVGRLSSGGDATVRITNRQVAYAYLESMHNQDLGTESMMMTPRISDQTLYRGIDFDNPADHRVFYDIEPGDTIGFGLASFSPNRATANAFGTQVQLIVRPGAKSLTSFESDFERITGGEFKVLSNRMVGTGGGPMLEIELEQVGTYDPDTGKVAKSAAIRIDRFLSRSRLRKHAAPIHPGTGTDQTVHGGGGSGRNSQALDQQAIDARWLDDGALNGPASRALAFLRERNIHFRLGESAQRDNSLRVMTALPRVIAHLEEKGITVYPTSIILSSADALQPALATTHANGSMTFWTNNMGAAQFGKPDSGYKFGDNSVHDTYIHELGHVIDARSEAIDGTRLYDKYGSMKPWSNYSDSTYTKRMSALGFTDEQISTALKKHVVGDRGEYAAEVFTAAVLADDNRGGPNPQKVPPELRQFMLDEAKLAARVTKALPSQDLCLGLLSGISITKHAGPIHPGTGTDQSVHGSGSTKTFYHLTDDPKFTLRSVVPTDNALAIFAREEPGIYLTDNPEHWVNGYGYVRPFLVEFSVTGDPEGGRWGGEAFVPVEDFGQLTIKRVIPLDEYAREHYGDYGWIEGTLDEGAQGVGNIRTFPDYEYTGPDVRDFSPEEVEQHKQRARRAWVARGHGTAEEAQDLFKHAAPIHPGTGTDQSVHGSGSTAILDRSSDIRPTPRAEVVDFLSGSMERDTIISGIPVTIRMHGADSYDMDRVEDELTAPEEYLAPVFERVPDALWDAAGNPRVIVVVNDNRLAQLVGPHNEETLFGEGLYVMGEDDGPYTFEPDGDKTLYLSLKPERPKPGEFVVPQDRLTYNLVHELSHGISMPRIWGGGLDEAASFRNQVLKGFFTDPYSPELFLEPDIDHPWAYAYAVPIPHEFVADAMAYRIMGENDIISDAEKHAPGLTDYIDGFFPNEQVIVVKRNRLLRTIRCATAQIPPVPLRKHYGPGPHPGTMTEQSVHGRSGVADVHIDLSAVEAKYGQLRDSPSSAPQIRDWALAKLTEGREFLTAYVYSGGVTPEEKALEARLGSWVHRLNNLYYTAHNMDPASEVSRDDAFEEVVAQVTTTPTRRPRLFTADYFADPTITKHAALRLIKHYGPGPHPSGTPQTSHGGDSAPTIAPSVPESNVTFSVQDLDEWGDEILAASTPLPAEDQVLVRDVVEDFREFLPGALPSDLEVRVATSPTEGVLAFVVPDGDHDNIVYLNEDSWFDENKLLDSIRASEENPWTMSWGEAIRNAGTDAEKITLTKQLAVFHELGHIAAIQVPGMSPLRPSDMVSWPDSIPYYGPDWYEYQVDYDDATLPSAYATTMPPEYFAEALTDAWANENPAPLSQTTVEAFRRIISP